MRLYYNAQVKLLDIVAIGLDVGESSSQVCLDNLEIEKAGQKVKFVEPMFGGPLRNGYPHRNERRIISRTVNFDICT
jgi:hypothetical protein